MHSWVSTIRLSPPRICFISIARISAVDEKTGFFLSCSVLCTADDDLNGAIDLTRWLHDLEIQCGVDGWACYDLVIVISTLTPLVVTGSYMLSRSRTDEVRVNKLGSFPHLLLLVNNKYSTQDESTLMSMQEEKIKTSRRCYKRMTMKWGRSFINAGLWKLK